MSEPLHVAPRPCSTCPYRRATPPGIWAPEEYAKLSRYDAAQLDPVDLSTFHCHQQLVTGVATACRGWLSVHADSAAVRLAVVTGRIDPATIPPEVEPDLYASGAEACAAGLAGVDDVSEAAFRSQVRLMARAHFKTRDEP